MSELKSTALRGMSKHERKFLLLWKACGGPNLIPEFQFAPPRRWRFDFCFLRQGVGVAIECEGGVWMKGGGGHNHGLGFEKDAEKYLEAVLLGFVVIRLHEKQINAPTIQRIIQFVNCRLSP